MWASHAAAAGSEADASPPPPPPPPPAAEDASPPPPLSDEDAAAARAAMDDLLSLASTPVDLLSFAPRAALGALLSLPDLTERLCVSFSFFT